MGRITINELRCKGCGVCVHFCARGCIELAKEMNRLGYHAAVFKEDNGECKACKICAEMCPDACIEVWRDKKDKSGGGED